MGLIPTADWTPDIEETETSPADIQAHRAFPSLVAAAATQRQVDWRTAQDWACLSRGADLAPLVSALRAFCVVRALPDLSRVIAIRPGTDADSGWKGVCDYDWTAVCCPTPGMIARARHLYLYARNPIRDYHEVRSLIDMNAGDSTYRSLILKEYADVGGALGDLGIETVELHGTGPAAWRVSLLVAAYNLLSKWTPPASLTSPARAQRFELAAALVKEVQASPSKAQWFQLE